MLKQHTSEVVISMLMAASNNIRSSREEKGQIKQIALAPTLIPMLGFAMTVKIRDSRILLTNNF